MSAAPVRTLDVAERGAGGRWPVPDRSVIATVLGEQVRLTSRNGKDLTATFPELAELVEAIDPEVREVGQTVIDGEIVALDANDRPSFGRLQQRLGLTAEADVTAARKQVEKSRKRSRTRV